MSMRALTTKPKKQDAVYERGTVNRTGDERGREGRRNITYGGILSGDGSDSLCPCSLLPDYQLRTLSYYSFKAHVL